MIKAEMIKLIVIASFKKTIPSIVANIGTVI
jgi:hypothetical protein